jgi:hypothetical protein
VGRRLVIALVLQIPGISRIIRNSFAHSDEVLLDVLRKGEFGLLGVFAVGDQG